jgi:hypothetical protein
VDKFSKVEFVILLHKLPVTLNRFAEAIAELNALHVDKFFIKIALADAIDFSIFPK